MNNESTSISIFPGKTVIPTKLLKSTELLKILCNKQNMSIFLTEDNDIGIEKDDVAFVLSLNKWYELADDYNNSIKNRIIGRFNYFKSLVYELIYDKYHDHFNNE